MPHRVRDTPTWADVLDEFAAEPSTAARLIGQLGACEAASLAFCRLLERWARGDANPPTSGGRHAALRLAEPLERYLLELEADALEGRSWYGAPGAAELVDWAPVLGRAGVPVAPERVAQAYLELAVLVRALEGLTAAARVDALPDRSSLWAGLFDLRDNLLGRALDDVRALAVT
jgi:hypothetical protein